MAYGILGITVGMLLGHMYSRPNELGVQRPSYLALRNDIIVALYNEYHKTQDKSYWRTTSDGFSKFLKALVN